MMMMKKTILLCVMGLMGLMGPMGLRAQGQTVGCNDTVHWGTPLSFESNKCCWTVLEGPTDCFYSSYNQIDCNYDTLADHRFLSPWVEVPSFAATDSVVLIYATQVSCTAEYSVAITTDGVNYDTLRHRLVDAYQHDTIMLGAYAGQVIRIQFCHYGLNSSFDPYAGDCSYAADYHWQLLFSALQWRSLVYPVVSWWVPAKAYVGETTWLRASLADGSRTGLTYTWHSSLTGQTLTGDSATLVYTAAGVDTLTLIATNAYGSDTLTQTVTVVDCSGVVTAHPWVVDFRTDFDCWRNLGNANWNYGLENNTLPFVSATAYSKHHILVSPAVQLPADSTGLQLYWRAKRYSMGNQNYRVLVTTGAWDSLAGYDTVYTSTLATSWQDCHASLAEYAGQTVHIAFDVQRNSTSGTLYISDVKMYNALTPMGTLESPTTAVATGDTVHLALHLTQGSDSLLSYSWHSTLLDTTFTTSDSVLDVVYPLAGDETLTATASNAYGSLELTASYSVFDCGTISSFPWSEDFVAMGTAAPYDACWKITGWWHLEANHSFGSGDEDGNYITKNDILRSTTTTGQPSCIITPAIAVPTTGVEHLALWITYWGRMTMTVSTQGDSALTLFTDTLFTDEDGNSMFKTRTFALAPYAGQTLHAAVTTSRSYQYIDRIAVDYDTLPKLTAITAPSKTRTDSTAVCSVAMRRGDTTGMTYTWHSTLTGQSATTGSQWAVTYDLGGTDTISVIGTNAYGSDTASTTVQVIDCTPATTLPWRETFNEGITCWYKPEGSNWAAATYYGYDPKTMRSLSNYDTLPNWIMSKAITLPADSGMGVRLFWDVSFQNNYHPVNYSVWVTGDDDYTDTSHYSLLYLDTAIHARYTSFDHMSASLAAYAGQTLHVAFRNMTYNSNTSAALYIDNVTVRATALPVVSIAAPATAYTSDLMDSAKAVLSEGSSTGLTYTWHSTLMGTTSTGSRLALAYSAGGTDTLTLVASNAYGADTATALITVIDCQVVSTLPYEEDFATGSDLSCWRNWNFGTYRYSPYSWHSSWVGTRPTMRSNTNSGVSHYNTWLVSPAIQLPADGDGLNFDLDIYGSSSYTGGVSYPSRLKVLVSTTGGSDTAMFTDTLSNDFYVVRWEHLQRSLAAYAGQTIHIALVNNTDNNNYLRHSGIDVADFRVGYAYVPEVTALTATAAFVGDTTTYSATLNNCVSDSLSYRWHSTLMDTTIATLEPVLAMVYDREGADTVTFIAANAYGADTATTTHAVTSHPLPEVTLTAPGEASTGDSVAIGIVLNDCSQNGRQVTLHSTLLDTTLAVAETTATIVYTVSGIDTLTAIVVNHYGADTATAVVSVADCGHVTAPYFMDFESVAATAHNVAGVLPLCWESQWSGSNATYAPHVITTGGYPYLSNLPDNALLMLAGNTGSGYANQTEVLLPAFEDSLQRLSLALDYRHESSTNGTLMVGYYDTMFHVLRVLPAHTGSYRRDTVTFDSVTAPNARIALRWQHNSSWWGVAIDNIQVFIDNNIPSPSGLTADNLTASCATLRWHPVDGATAYHVEVPGVADTLVADTALTVCGLEEDHDYSFSVTAHVGSEVGHASGYVPFRTLVYCTPLTALTADETGLVSWQFDDGGEATPTGVALEIADLTAGSVWADTVTGTSLMHSFAAGHRYSLTARTLCGNAEAHATLTAPFLMPGHVCAEATGNSTSTNARFMDNFWSKNYSQVLYPATFAAGVDTLYGIALRVSQFSQPFSNSAQYKFDIYVGETDSSSLTAPIPSTSLSAVALNKEITISSTGWVALHFDSIFTHDGTSNLIVTLVERPTNAYSGRYFGVHADSGCTHFVQSADFVSGTINPATLNFAWTTTGDIPDIRLLGGCAEGICLAPSVAVVATDTHSVSLGWGQQGTETLWQVEYRIAGESTWTVADTTSATHYTVGGLLSVTPYEFRVASLCDGTALYSTAIGATTPCGEIVVPYHIDFRNADIPCWTLDPDISHSSSYGLYMGSGKQVISPLVADNFANLYATVRTYGGSSTYYNDTYAIGVCDGDGSNTVWVDTITLSTVYGNHEHTIYFNHYSGTGDHIVVRILSGIIDLREFDLNAVDFCIPARALTATAVTDTSATLQWTANDPSHTFAVYVDGQLQGVTSASSYPLTGLDHRRHYRADVREICGAGDTADAATIHFRTRCTATETLPYFEEFDYAAALYGDTLGLPQCWDSIGESNVHFSSFSDGALTVMNFSSYESWSGSFTSYLTTPVLDIPTQGARIRFKGQASHDGIVTAGIMTDPSDVTTFVAMSTITYNNRGLAWYEFTTDSLGSLGDFAVAFRWASDGGGALDSLFVTALPAQHTVSVGCDSTMGTVYGSGVYADSSTVTLLAIPHSGYRFDAWNDGDTHALRSIVVTCDTTFYATFTTLAPDTVWRTVSVSAEPADICETYGSGRYADGSTVEIGYLLVDTATSGGHWAFTGWSDGSTDNPRQIAVTSDTALVARFEWVADSTEGIGDSPTVAVDFDIYPNPATVSVTVQSTHPGSLVLMDVSGRVMTRWHVDSGKQTLPVGDLPRGVYFVRHEASHSVKKLIIQ